MSVRVIFFNGFVGRTAKNPEHLIRERIEAAVERFTSRACLDEEGDRIKKVIIVGEAGQLRYSGFSLMKHLGARGIPVDQMELAGDATSTFRAIQLFLIKTEELFPGQHVRVHVATHRWLLYRTVYYMRRWHRPDTDKPLPLKARGCCPVVGYEPNWRERVRECFRQSDAEQAILLQDCPEAFFFYDS